MVAGGLLAILDPPDGLGVPGGEAPSPTHWTLMLRGAPARNLIPLRSASDSQGRIPGMWLWLLAASADAGARLRHRVLPVGSRWDVCASICAGAMLAERVGPLPAQWTGTSAWASRCGRQI